tara:strand:- start:3727 stop:4986 length:1260 start_codon:yes stop_codon:yes gene_type:complete
VLTWYRPKPNEVNFLPWLEHYLERRRGKRLFFYGCAVAVVVLGMAAFGWLYFNLLQVQAGVQRQVSEGVQQLHVQQQQMWASSLERRSIDRGQVIQAQQNFHAWLPVQELSRLLKILTPKQHLVSWQWQSMREGRQVEFSITGKGSWQHWWQEALKVWPPIHMRAVGPEGDGWKFEARYLLPIMPLTLPVGNTSVMTALKPFALQLTPKPLVNGAGVKGESIEYMTRQLAKYGQGIEIVRGQGVQVKMHLNSTQWADLAPLPNALGWNLQHLSIEQASSEQWQVIMQWLPSSDTEVSYLLRLAPSASVQARTRAIIEHYSQGPQGQALAAQAIPESISPAPGKPDLAGGLQVIGYSQQQDEVPVIWIKSSLTGQLQRAEVGHYIDGWRLLSIGAQGVRLTRGQKVIMLQRHCLIGVCEK